LPSKVPGTGCFSMLLVHLCKPRFLLRVDSFKRSCWPSSACGVSSIDSVIPVLQLGSHPSCTLYCICSSVYSLAHTLAVFCTASAVPAAALLVTSATPSTVFCTTSVLPDSYLRLCCIHPTLPQRHLLLHPSTTYNSLVAPSATLLRLLLHLFRLETSPSFFSGFS